MITPITPITPPPPITSHHHIMNNSIHPIQANTIELFGESPSPTKIKQRPFNVNIIYSLNDDDRYLTTTFKYHVIILSQVIYQELFYYYTVKSVDDDKNFDIKVKWGIDEELWHDFAKQIYERAKVIKRLLIPFQSYFKFNFDLSADDAEKNIDEWGKIVKMTYSSRDLMLIMGENTDRLMQYCVQSRFIPKGKDIIQMYCLSKTMIH